MEYVLHLTNIHYGLLECAYCDAEISRGLRCLPDFRTLADHVRYFHKDVLAEIAKRRGYEVAPGSIPAGAFRP
jgi:hypothetical protein